MPSFFIRTGNPALTLSAKRYFLDKGWEWTTTFPADFVFIQGLSIDHYEDIPDTKQSKWVSLVWGKAKDILTNKLVMSLRFANSGFVPRSWKITPLTQIPSLKKGIYILKPVAGFAGSGIRIVRTEEEAREWRDKHPAYTNWVLQEYIDDPDTIKGHKFHVRVWVCVIIRNGVRSVWFSDRNRIFLAAKPYKSGDWEDKGIHDTHLKSNPQVSFYPETKIDGWTEEDIDRGQTSMMDIIKTLWKSVEKEPLRVDMNGKNGFEVMGADIMFTDKKAYIYEFNKKTGLHSFHVSYTYDLLDLILTGKAETWTRVI